MTNTRLSPNISLSLIIVGAIFVHLIRVLPRLIQHTSDTPIILSRYSIGYGLAVALGIVILLGWLGAWIWRHRLQTLLAKLPNALVLGGIVLSSLGLVVLQETGFRRAIIELLSVNWMLGWVIILRCQSFQPTKEAPLHQKRWQIAAAALVVVVMIPALATILLGRPYSPDEAIWADLMSTPYVEGGIFVRSGFGVPTTITPGVGWIHAINGFLQQLVDFDLRVSRLINFGYYIFGIGGIFLLARRLFGWKAGVISALVALLGTSFIRIYDYRGDHFVIVAQTFAFWALIAGFQINRPRHQLLWHAAAGLIVTLGMQLHASALGYCIGLSLYYGGNALWRGWQNHTLTLEILRPLIGFGAGATIGTLIYIGFNVMPVGGFEAFLNTLLNERGSGIREFWYLSRWNASHFVLIYGAFAYLLWRRRADDIRYVAVVGCSIIGITLVDTQGYLVPYMGMMLAPVGSLLIDGFQENARRRGWILAVIFITLSSRVLLWTDVADLEAIIRNRGVPTAQIERIGNDILPYIDEGEIIVGTHELIWAMPDNPDLYSPMAEGVTATQRDWEPTRVWEELQPDVYVDLPGRHVTPPGLAAYLESEEFIICETFDSQGYKVNIWRENCDS